MESLPPEPPVRKKRNKGAKLSKAEREARREAREQLAAADGALGGEYEGRRAQLRMHAAAGQWDEACMLGVQSGALAHELCTALIERANLRQLSH